MKVESKSVDNDMDIYYVGCAYGQQRPTGKFRNSISISIEETREKCKKLGIIKGKIIRVFPTYGEELKADIYINS